MLIRVRKETKSEKAIQASVAAQPPATMAQRVQATRIMGGIGYALFAGFLLTIGYAIFANSKTIRVDGTVVSSTSETTTTQGGSTRGQKSTVYWYTFQYTDQEGQDQIGETGGWGTSANYRTGDVVSVGYYADDPSKVRIRNWFLGWRYQIVLAGLGLALIAYSIKAVAILKAEAANEPDETTTQNEDRDR